MNTPDLRIAGLRRFGTAITVLTILGHTFFGFEPSYAYVFVSLLTAYVVDLVLETIDAKFQNRPSRCSGGLVNVINFLLPTHISALAIAMLLYANSRLMPIALAAAIAIGSKYIVRFRSAQGLKHFLNPSNTGICAVLILFPWVGITPPYQFTENLYGGYDWLLPAVLICLGTFLNYRFTRKLPLIAAWLGTFVLQAVLRHWFFDAPLLPSLHPMSGVAFLLFTFYMVTDPATTPVRTKAQVAFGASVALVYGLLITQHVVFGLFFALLIVCFLRGCGLYVLSHWPSPATAREVAAERA